jgi:hypothetical protein
LTGKIVFRSLALAGTSFDESSLCDFRNIREQFLQAVQCVFSLRSDKSKCVGANRYPLISKDCGNFGEGRISQTKARSDSGQYPREHAAEQCCFVFPSGSLATQAAGAWITAQVQLSDRFIFLWHVIVFCGVGRLKKASDSSMRELSRMMYESDNFYGSTSA